MNIFLLLQTVIIFLSKYFVINFGFCFPSLSEYTSCSSKIFMLRMFKLPRIMNLNVFFEL